MKIDFFIQVASFWNTTWSMISATIIGLTGIFFAYKNYRKKHPKTDGAEIMTNNNNSQSNQVILNLNPPTTATNEIDESLVRLDVESRKKLLNILFIDDDIKFKVVKILINEGWKNTKAIIDLSSYSDDKIKNSHIVFVDVQGVGKLLECKDEGLGLALNIKNKYPEKKVVIYSAIPTHKVFHEAIQKVDFLLSKDAEPYEFISLIERFSNEIDL